MPCWVWAPDAWVDEALTARFMPQQQRVTSFQSSIAEVLEYLHDEQESGCEQRRDTESDDH